MKITIMHRHRSPLDPHRRLSIDHKHLSAETAGNRGHSRTPSADTGVSCTSPRQICIVIISYPLTRSSATGGAQARKRVPVCVTRRFRGVEDPHIT